MRIDIDHILLEIESLPEYKTQLSLQITSDGNSGEGKLEKLNHTEKEAEEKVKVPAKDEIIKVKTTKKELKVLGDLLKKTFITKILFKAGILLKQF